MDKLNPILKLSTYEIGGKKILLMNQNLIQKIYAETTMKNVRNSREFKFLDQRSRVQELEIPISRKNIKEFKAQIDQIRKRFISSTQGAFRPERESHLKHKKKWVERYFAENGERRKGTLKKSEELQSQIERPSAGKGLTLESEITLKMVWQ